MRTQKLHLAQKCAIKINKLIKIVDYLLTTYFWAPCHFWVRMLGAFICLLPCHKTVNIILFSDKTFSAQLFKIYYSYGDFDGFENFFLSKFRTFLPQNPSILKPLLPMFKKVNKICTPFLCLVLCIFETIIFIISTLYLVYLRNL